MSGKRFLIFAIVALLIFSGVLLLVNVSGGLTISVFNGGEGAGQVEDVVEEGEDKEPVSTEENVIKEGPVVKLETSSTEWKRDEDHELIVSFESLPENLPNAITVHLIYDPDYVEVVEVTEGDLWTETNVLQREIDNEKGEVIFSAGQNFYSDVTENTTLANFKVKVIEARAWPISTEFELGPESAMTSLGIGEKLIMLKGIPITIKIKS